MNGDQALLNELALTARGRNVGTGDYIVQLVEVGLRDGAGAPRIGVAVSETDDTALLVIDDLGVPRDVLHGVDAIALAIDLLQIEAVDKMVADGAAVKQIDVESPGTSSILGDFRPAARPPVRRGRLANVR